MPRKKSKARKRGASSSSGLEASTSESPSKRLRGASSVRATSPETDADTVDLQSGEVLSISVSENCGAFCAYTCGRRGAMEDDHAEMSAPLADMFGVFDGHGGARCSAFCRDKLLGMVVSDGRKFKRNPGKSLRDAFVRADKIFCREARKAKHTDGTTATVLCIPKQKGGRYYVSNTGDSRTVLIKKDGSGVPLSDMHSPALASERARIEKQGGRVEFDTIDKIFRVDGVLAVSRAIGDFYVKPYVTGEPDVKDFVLSADDECVVLASDGLWDDVSPLEAGKVVADSGGDFSLAARSLVKRAYELGSEDNICVTVVPLKAYKDGAL